MVLGHTSQYKVNAIRCVTGPRIRSTATQDFKVTPRRPFKAVAFDCVVYEGRRLGSRDGDPPVIRGAGLALCEAKLRNAIRASIHVYIKRPIEGKVELARVVSKSALVSPEIVFPKIRNGRALLATHSEGEAAAAAVVRPRVHVPPLDLAVWILPAGDGIIHDSETEADNAGSVRGPEIDLIVAICHVNRCWRKEGTHEQTFNGWYKIGRRTVLSDRVSFNFIWNVVGVVGHLERCYGKEQWRERRSRKE